MAGVVYKLMSDSGFRRGATKPGDRVDSDFDAEAWLAKANTATLDPMNVPDFDTFMSNKKQFLSKANIPSVSFAPSFPSMPQQRMW